MHLTGVLLLTALSSTDGGAPVEVDARFGEGVTVKLGPQVQLQVRGRVQAQALFVIPGEASDVDAQQTGFVRRARLQLKGQLPWQLSFTLQLGFAPLDMEAHQPSVLRDLFVAWTPLRDLNLRVGQMKVPFDVQRVVSSSALQFADRSLVTAELNLDRDVGLVAYSDDLLGWGRRLRYAVGLFGGDGRNRLGTNTGLLYVARLRFAPLGELNDRQEGDVERARRFRFALGGAVARNVATDRPRSTTGVPLELAPNSYTHLTGDLHVKAFGLSLLASVSWRQADLHRDPSTGLLSATRRGLAGSTPVTEYSRSGWGFFVQAGAFVTDWLELVLRYGDLRPITPTDPSFSRQRELGGGLNFTIFRHDLKLVTDLFWIDDGHGRDGRAQLRAQLQIFF